MTEASVMNSFYADFHGGFFKAVFCFSVAGSGDFETLSRSLPFEPLRE